MRYRKLSVLGVAPLLSLAVALPSFATGDRGVVTFTVEVIGAHNRPTEEGGFRNTSKRRVFQGRAEMKYAGASPHDIWVSASCSGLLGVADAGLYKRLNPYEGWGTVPTSITAQYKVEAGALGADGCSFNIAYDPVNNTARINLDQPGPRRIEVVERTNISSVKTHINPFDWSALRKLESGSIKVEGNRSSHTGVWLEKGGEPVAMDGEKRVAGEVVETSTRIAWQFTRLAPKPGSTGGSAPPIPNPDADPAIQCLKEQEDRGVEIPDSEEFVRCLKEKQKARRR